MRRAAIFTMIGVALAVLVGPFGGATPPTEESEPAKPLVQLDRCNLKLIDHATLAADRAGVLEQIGPREGHLVGRGQILAGIRDELAAVELQIAEKKAANDIDVRFAAKAAKVAEAEYRRNVDANQLVPNTISKTELERLKLTAERSELQIEQARQTLSLNESQRDLARAQLKTYKIVAPFEGTIVRVFKSPGEAVQASEPVLELVSTKRLQVEGYLELRDLSKVKRGAPVKVQLDVPELPPELNEKTINGHVVFVDLTAQAVSQKVRVLAEVENQDGALIAGLPAKMWIYPPTATAAVAVP